VEIEDTQGSLEIIVFPRTFAEFQHLIKPEELVLVSGKVDAREEGKPKILADTLSTELTAYIPVEADTNGNNVHESLPPLPVAETKSSYQAQPSASTSNISLSLSRPSEPSDTPLDPWVSNPNPLLFILPRDNDLGQDIQRLKDVYHLLENSPGDRRFELCIRQNGHGIVIEYPLGIRYDKVLEERLTSLGVEIRDT
ncbi:MAG: OB-fold nucleic acid binding domain-containing protein, partial [Chloroflexota bacterium]